MNRLGIYVTNVAVVSILVLSVLPAHAVQLSEPHVHDHFEFVADTPLAQFQDHVPLNKITCAEGLELIMKKSNGMPACVKPASVAILIERGWGMHVLPDHKMEGNNSEMFETSKGVHAVKTETVNYFEHYNGYLAAPEAEGDFPGVVMIHEWWGLNDNIRDMAEELASHGYVVLAVDLYGEAATTSDEARQLRNAYDPEIGVINMNNAADYLQTNYATEKIGSIGWCFGGGESFNLALNNPEMDATVIYYGSITADKEQLASIDWPILGIFAGLDQGIPVELVNEFDMALDELGIQNDIHIYPNVNHAFANPSGDRYAPEATMDAWKKTLDFFDETLKS